MSCESRPRQTASHLGQGELNSQDKAEDDFNSYDKAPDEVRCTSRGTKVWM